jgi:hypothetical protein
LVIGFRFRHGDVVDCSGTSLATRRTGLAPLPTRKHPAGCFEKFRVASNSSLYRTPLQFLS